MIEIETMQSWLGGEPVWPYAKIIETWGPRFENWRVAMFRNLKTSTELKFDMDEMTKRYERTWRLRDLWITRFGFAIPCAELLDELAQHRLVVEVGAGSGYMTRLMRHRGINVIGSNPDMQDYMFKQGIWDEPDQVDADAKTMVRRYPDATIFCSWPTLNHTWFRQMLQAMKIGQRLIVIQEGACAERTAWHYLDDCFDQTDTITLPVFEFMSDFASVHIKKRNRPRNGTAM